MSSRRKAKAALALALLLLVLSGGTAGLLIVRLYSAEALIRHTYDVEIALGDIESALATVGRSRVAYIDSPTPESLQAFTSATGQVASVLARIRQLTHNPTQQKLYDQLEENVRVRIAASRDAVELKRQGQSDPAKQLEFTVAVAKTAFDTSAIMQQMKQNENALLEERTHLSSQLFSIVLGTLLASFVLSAVMFWIYYRLLNRELVERGAAEEQLRRLSLDLMRVQDEERRKFARELHDGLGQNIVAAKIIADTLAVQNPDEERVNELSSALADALTQVRTVSYLLHPPLLDEVGFASAANWLIEGYAKRVGIAVSASIAGPEPRLPRNIELTLYRILQEALNNIHRHAHAAKVEVSVQRDAESVTLRVKDFGRGIPPETIEALQANAAKTGVGLTGMKERVHEQGGVLQVRSDDHGTEIIVKIPIRPQVELSDVPPTQTSPEANAKVLAAGS